MKLPTCIYVWTGETMQPTLHFARLAESSFTSGQAYRLIVAEESEKKTKRSKLQNDKMWAMLTEISEQAEHCGRRYSADEWKILFMHACGHDVKFLPALDHKTFVPYGGRSSQMSAMDMAELIEFIQWWGTQNGVRFATDRGTTWDITNNSP